MKGTTNDMHEASNGCLSIASFEQKQQKNANIFFQWTNNSFFQNR